MMLPENDDIPLMEVIESHIERHKSVSHNHPELERIYRYDIFTSLFWGFEKAYRDGTIETQKEMLQKVIDSVRPYDYTDCGLSAGQTNAVKLILNDMRRFILGMRASEKRRDIMQSAKMTGKIKAVFHSHRTESSEDLLEYPHYWVDGRYAEPIRQLKKIGQSHGIYMASASKADYKDADVFFFWDYPKKNDEVFAYATESSKKTYLIATEPEVVVPMNYDLGNKDIFAKIFTWRESLVDNEKFFKIRPITFSFPKNISPLPFGERMPCVIIATINRIYNYPDELYSKRLETVEWFEQNHPDDLDFFGRNTKHNDTNHSSYKGGVRDKLSVLCRYKTCICYENNCADDAGYITEKIFDAFFCGCIPVYWGAPNVSQIIPKECYIDRREFDTHEQLHGFIKSMDEQQYNKYIEAINAFLETEFAKSYNENALAATILKECFDIDLTQEGKS
jgi:hypothetical protein